MPVCTTPVASRRKLFWATQANACGQVEDCATCGIPGLTIEGHGETCGVNCRCCPPATTPDGCTVKPPLSNDAVISTKDWITGLIINMLMTDARRGDKPCGYTPGSQGGHWSENYAPNETIGSLLNTSVDAPTIDESVTLTVGYTEATLSKLISRGVATNVNVTGEYVGNGRIALQIEVEGTGIANNRVGVTAGITANGWVWG